MAVSTYFVSGILVWYFQRVHGSDHGIHGHEYILVDQFDETALVLVRVTRAVNDTHLLDERTLARLASTCRKNRRRAQSISWIQFF